MPGSEGGSGGRGWTRRELVERAAGGGAGLFLAGSVGSLAGTVFGVAEAEAAPGTSSTVQVFHSRPDLRPPAVSVVQAAREAAPGYLFISPSSGPGQRGVLMLDDAGEVVWFRSTAPQTAMNFRAARYDGKPVLTWWQGKSEGGTGNGEGVIADQSYRVIARLRAGRHLPTDLHEFLLTERGTALVTATETRLMNLTRLGGRARWPVTGSVVQELEVPSGRVLFEWHSLDHVALEESHQTIGPHFDYFHANSIAVDADGNLIVSARNTWAIYKIERRSGRVLWRLGGKKSDFAMAKGTFFAWQHDARPHGDGSVISLFDDGAAPAEEPQSRALLIALDRQRKRATLMRAYTHTPKLQAKYTGSAQLLPNGDMLVGWGSEPYFTEFAHDGAVRFDAKLPKGGQTYRALRFPWSGRPSTRPTLVSVDTGGSPALFASWNGATDVAAWQLFTGSSAATLAAASTTPRGGFETRIAADGVSGYAAVTALDAAGQPLGRSAAVRV